MERDRISGSVPMKSPQEAEYEGQIFEIPASLRDRRGRILEWSSRVAGLLLIVGGGWVMFSGRLTTTSLGIVIAFLLLLGYTLFTGSWNIRCRRFGWRFRYIGTWQYLDRGEKRRRVAVPAPGAPRDVEEARTSFWIGTVRRIDGSRDW